MPAQAMTREEMVRATQRQLGVSAERAADIVSRSQASAMQTLSNLLPERVELKREVIHHRRAMNKTEQRRADELEAKRRAGDIQTWMFEGLTLRLADDCRYTPDFLVIENDLRITLEEIKGVWRDDARVKIRVAADRFPWFTFVALRRLKQKQGGGWAIERF